MKLLSVTLLLLTFSVHSLAMICGEDDRQLYADSRIGRMKLFMNDNGCTVTMISKNCALTAGHCLKHMKTVEFNVPLSVRGKAQFAGPQDVYSVDPNSIVYMEVRPSNDWAVIKLKKNMYTRLSAGEAYGYFPVNFNAPQVGEEVRISGYGRDDRPDGSRNFVLQSDYGKITAMQSLVFGKAIHYRIDGTGGTSGSAILRTKQQDIVGIHTHGGCNSIDNHGTSIADRPELQKAIVACLGSDK